MFKPETIKQTCKFLSNYKKFISKLFGIKAIGETKQEAEENLYKIIEWNMSSQFIKYFQVGKEIAILKYHLYPNQYTYSRIENGREQGSTLFEAKNNMEAIEKAQEYFNQYLECTGGLSA